MNQQQQDAIDYLREENRILREQLGGRRLRLNDDQRRRLASKAKRLGRKMLAAIATIVTPETLLAWRRKLIARKIRRQFATWARSTQDAGQNRSAGGETGDGESGLGLPAHFGSAMQSGPSNRSRDGGEHSGKKRHRAGSGAEAENDLEGVTEAPLGADRGRRFFQRRGVDAPGTPAVRSAIRNGAIHAEGGGGRDRSGAE